MTEPLKSVGGETLSKERSRQFVRNYKERSLNIVAGVPEGVVVDLIQVLEKARREERVIFLCGNGGSAATSGHLACELGKEGSWGKQQRFRMLSLADGIPWMTAIANDSDYSRIFVEQLKNFGSPGDVLLAFSGSGNSQNVVEAVVWARQNGLYSVGITGEPGGRLALEAEHVIQVPSSHIGHIQEGHFLIQHLLAYFFIECVTESEPGNLG